MQNALSPLSADRARGALLGLAVGDAMGMQVEFCDPGSFPPVTDLGPGGPFDLPEGFWTDDTSMALCLAESLLARQAFEPLDQMHRYVRWYRLGHWSSTGRCFDIGSTTRRALEHFEGTGDAYAGSESPSAAGNGSLMRLAPVPIVYALDPRRAIHYAALSSRTTHGARTAVDACRFMAGLIAGALAGADRESLLSPRYTPVPDLWDQEPLSPEIQEIADGSYLRKNPPRIRGSGYVVHSLEAALWAFSHSTSFEEGLLLAVNLGDDADTTGAVYGQLAGSFYGAESIPLSWRSRLYRGEEIAGVADRLWALAQTGPQ